MGKAARRKEYWGRRRTRERCHRAAIVSLAVCDGTVNPYLGERQHNASASRPRPLRDTDDPLTDDIDIDTLSIGPTSTPQNTSEPPLNFFFLAMYVLCDVYHSSLFVLSCVNCYVYVFVNFVRCRGFASLFALFS